MPGSVITSTRRLARRLQRERTQSRLATGFLAWAPLDVLPWPAWLQRTWRHLVYAGCETNPILSERQERLLWQRIIEDSAQGRDLLRADSAADLAARAWAVAHQWRLPLNSAVYDAAEDTAAFRSWAHRFRAVCEEIGYVDSAQAPDRIARASFPKEPASLAGFDELTPQQETLAAVFGFTLRPVPFSSASRAIRTILPEGEAEIEAAAQWARRKLLANPKARIGIVCPGLDASRTAIERILEDAVGGAFHIALGPPLSRRPAIHAALLLLETIEPRLPLSLVTQLLLSPWLADSDKEGTARARFDARLRREGQNECSLAYLTGHKDCPPLFGKLLAGLSGGGERRAQPAGGWSRVFSSMLGSAGWPGPKPLDSVEFQTVEAFREALSELAALEPVTEPMAGGAALDLLRRIAAETPFEVEERGEPVQVLGLLDATVEVFDHVWILSLDDETWPRAAVPNPFLPLSLQQAHNVPHATPERELEFAKRVVRRLLRSSSEVVVSSAATAGERELAPSPLITHLPFEREAHAPKPWYFVPATLEWIEDQQAPPVAGDAGHRGGTRTLKLQADCPFRAFAELRLNARPLESPALGYDARDRGQLLHEALRLCWKELQSQDQLLGTPAERIAEIVDSSVSGAIRDSKGSPESRFQERLQRIEHRRLSLLLRRWLELERTRAERFEVLPLEQDSWITIGGLKLRGRIDRVDRLSDGSLVVIDYKSTAPALTAWEGDRPEEPQLPLYAVTRDRAVSAVAFAQVQTGNLMFRGYGAEPPALPGLKIAEIPDLLDEWRGVLVRLAGDFQTGFAAVDPKDAGACAYCHLHTMCRIHESQ